MLDDTTPQSKLQKIIEIRFEDADRKFSLKGKKSPAYGLLEDIISLVYNPQTGKISKVQKFQSIYKGKGD